MQSVRNTVGSYEGQDHGYESTGRDVRGVGVATVLYGAQIIKLHVDSDDQPEQLSRCAGCLATHTLAR